MIDNSRREMEGNGGKSPAHSRQRPLYYCGPFLFPPKLARYQIMFANVHWYTYNISRRWTRRCNRAKMFLTFYEVTAARLAATDLRLSRDTSVWQKRTVIKIGFGAYLRVHASSVTVVSAATISPFIQEWRSVAAAYGFERTMPDDAFRMWVSFCRACRTV